VLALVISHGLSFKDVFLGKGECLRVSWWRQKERPYLRLIVLHMTIILGAIAAALVGSPVGALVTMVAVKTAVDLWAHLKEHKTAQSRPPMTDDATTGNSRGR